MAAFASEVEKRTQAKKQTKNVFYIILFSNLSLIIAILFLEIANVITKYFWNSVLNEQITELSIVNLILSINPLLGVIYAIIFIVYGIPLLMKILTRWVVIIFSTVALPIIIVMYFFMPTKNYGLKFGKLFLINAFFPIIWILVFAFGKVVVEILVGGNIFLEGFANIIVFATCLYINNMLYKRMALDLRVKDMAGKAVAFGAAVYKYGKYLVALAG